MVGQQIGPYRILDRLGAGGMGEVFLAEDPRLGRRVAIKRPTDTAPGQIEARERLRREAHAAAQINHPNVAAIYDVLDSPDPDGPPHIVMEYVEGETLAALIGRSALTPEVGLTMARQIADALVEAHAKGVIHRDLKPANVMVTPERRVKVLDFGLAGQRVADARSVQDTPSLVSQIYGTPGYMAPEQIMGERGDARSDVYGFGALLFEMLTGSAPFSGVDPLARVMSGSRSAPPEPQAINPAIPAELNHVVVKALAFHPKDRFQTAESLREALERAAGAMSEAPTGPVARTHARRLPRRHVLAGVAVVLAILAVGLLWWRGGEGARDRTATIVAVLPFEITEGAADLEALGVGLAEMIVNGLAATDTVTAVPRSALAPYRNRTSESDLQRIAKDLGVNHVVGGALRRTPAGIELTIRIVRVQDDDKWQRSYPGALDDVLTLGRRILGDVVVELGAASTTVQAGGTSVEAFQQYSQGRSLLERRDVPGNIDRAIELLASAVKRESNFALAHAALGEAYWEKYRQTREPEWVNRAEQQILIALSVDPNQPLVRYSLATIFNGTGQTGRAEEELRAIASKHRLDSAHRMLGIILADRGQTDDAIKEFERAIEIRPGFWANYSAKGIAALKAGRYPDAELSFLRVTELQPDNADAYGYLGTAYLLTGQRERAIDFFKRSIQLAPSVPAWSNLGSALMEAGRNEEALAAFQQALALRPRDPLMQRNIGDILVRLGRIREARAAYSEGVRVAREAVAVNQKNPEAHGALALCLAKTGELDEALKHVETATALAPNAHQSYYRRAAILALAGRRDEALAALRAALQRGLSPAIVVRDDDFKALQDSKEFQQLIKSGV